MLKVDNIHVAYMDAQILQGVSLQVEANEIVTLVGGNAAGKSTLLKTISGLVRPTSGLVEWEGQNITGLDSSEIVDLGIILVPEGRRLFPDMTVIENLELGAYSSRARKRLGQSLDQVFSLFPVLAERRDQLAGSLSGGEQQMCAIGRGLMAQPKFLMLDEPSLGLAPLIVEKIFEVVRTIHKEGVTIFLVEQHVHKAMAIADRGYVIEFGKIVLNDTGERLLANPELKKAYLGM
ncbi:MAG: ABC transporter ATP-binding protein [Eubacteriales bacterium]